MISLYLLAQLAFAAPQQAPGNPLHMLPMTIVFIALFYLLIIRPQKKKQQAQSQMIDTLKKDDHVATSGGILGVIIKIEDSWVHLKISKNTVIQVMKQHIARVMPHNTYEE